MELFSIRIQRTFQLVSTLYEYKLDLVREVTHLLLKKDKLDREIHEMEARINDLESRFENLLDIEK